MFKTKGIHHISAIVGNPQENFDFYSGILGLRLVKKTVNFEDPGAYHLYFGNDKGSPGTIMTFFPWVKGFRGRVGTGQVGATSFAIPQGSMPFWEKRLHANQVLFNKRVRFGETYLSFDDPHGLQLELVEREEGARSEWPFNGGSPETAIKGFAGAVLLSSSPGHTMGLLRSGLGFEAAGKEGNYVRYRSEGEFGNIIDVDVSERERGRMGTGTVHHIAFRAQDSAEQIEARAFIINKGYTVTPVKNRKYFQAIYFKEHGDILFEIATDPPGFLIDEELDHLGESLMLPDEYEDKRGEIEASLIEIRMQETE